MVIRARPVLVWLVAMAVLLVALSGCMGSPQQPSEAAPDAVPTQRPTTGPTATPTATPEEEVHAAFLHYWEAYSEALLNLNPELVHGVAAKDELARIHDEVEGLRMQGVAIRTKVEHNIAVLDVRADTAVVLDSRVNNSYYVDPITKQPPQGQESGEILRDTYYFEKTGGQWLVVRSTRQR